MSVSPGSDTCTNCDRPAAHEAEVSSPYWSTVRMQGWVAYCCECFDHNWKPQRPIAGRECAYELVETPAPVMPPRREWRRKGTHHEE